MQSLSKSELAAEQPAAQASPTAHSAHAVPQPDGPYGGPAAAAVPLLLDSTDFTEDSGELMSCVLHAVLCRCACLWVRSHQPGCSTMLTGTLRRLAGHAGLLHAGR